MAKGKFDGANTNGGRAGGGGGGGSNEPEKSFRDKVKDATTKEELLNVLRTKYTTDDDFVNKNNLDKVKRVIDTVEQLQERYPMAGNFIRRLRESSDGIASMSNLGDLSINSQYYGDNGRVSGEWYKKERGWFPPNSTPESMVAHEFGHVMHNLYFDRLMAKANSPMEMFDLLKKRNSGAYLRDIEKKAMKKVRAKSKLDFYKQISGYATETHLHQSTKGRILRVGVFEAIAESFHDVFSNGDNAGAASKALVESMLEALQ